MTVKTVVAVAGVLTLWVAIAAADSAPRTNGGVTLQDKAQAERGMAVYAEQKCSVCHSIAGKGNAKGPLDDVGSRLTADQIHEWIVNPAEMTKKTKAERKPMMRAYPKLPKADLDALVAYMLTLKK
jgi:mono/diheme cytochrome c family protein